MVANLSLALLSLLIGSQTPLKAQVLLKPGDSLVVFVATSPKAPYSGEVFVQTDGCIYGVGYGKIKVSGLTPDQAQLKVRNGLKRLFHPEDVYVTLGKQRLDVVYVLGANSTGPVEIIPGLTLRQLLPGIKAGENLDRLEVQLLRRGKLVASASYRKVLDGKSAAGDKVIEPNDIVSLVPEQTLQVWVLGGVKQAGLKELPLGTTAYQAISMAGGLSKLATESKIVVRRGPETSEYPATAEATSNLPALQEGDVVTVVINEDIRVTVSGKISRQGELIVPGHTTLSQALAMAGGATADGSLSKIMVLRGGQPSFYNLLPLKSGSAPVDPKLETGDTIYLLENDKAVFVMGLTNRNGRMILEEGKSYRATDALAWAGGLSNNDGSYRRVTLMRPNPNGKPILLKFNLDEFLKDGKAEANPALQDGDVLLFGPSNGFNYNSVVQALSSILVIRSLTG